MIKLPECAVGGLVNGGMCSEIIVGGTHCGCERACKYQINQAELNYCQPNDDVEAQLPGEQYTPSNSTDGYAFIASFCAHCQRDKVQNGTVPMGEEAEGDLCEIIGASFLGEAIQWRRREDGNVTCTAFVAMDAELPPQRCDKTIDMFGGAA